MTAEDNASAPIAEDNASAPIGVEAGRVRSALGRSTILISLFDFLLERSLAGMAPKEIEIAQEVFGKTTDFDMAQDASVRVYIHRLRYKIDQFYAGASGPRLVIPKGEYRLTLEQGEAEPEAVPLGPETVPDTSDAIPGHRARIGAVGGRRFWVAGAALLAINLLAWLLIVSFRPVDPNRALAKGFFWNALATNARPTFVVTGDYYIFGEAPDEMEVTRLVRQFTINSRDDLDRYLSYHPDERGRYIDVNLHYLPTSTARVLADVLPIADAAATDNAIKPWVLAGSELTPDTLKGASVLYVGLFSALGILRDPLFDASGFKVGASYDELVDRVSGKHYTSDWGTVADDRMPRRDYAYLASVPGASGNRILVIAGTRDTGVMQAAEIASDKAQLDQIARRIGPHDAFEALYEVRTLGNINLGSTLIVARALGGSRPPGAARPDQIFPDQLPTENYPHATKQ